MFAVSTWKTVVITTFAAVSCYAASGNSPETTAPNVTYTARGTFATPPASGADPFQLAGQPFTLAVVASAATVPTKHGGNWAQYNGLSMTGTIHTSLVPTPFAIANHTTDILLATGNPSVDFFKLGTWVRIASVKVTISAVVSMPKSTIANALIHPFTAPVKLTPANAVITYSEGRTTTTLGINGTLSTSLSPALLADGLRPAQAPVPSAGVLCAVRRLHSGPLNLRRTTVA